MLYKSPIIAEGSGSIAGCVLSHNRGGAYMRARVTPTNPNTAQQQAVRSFMAANSAIWSSTLTEAQRAAWDTYALNVPLPGPFGDPRNVGGIGMFQRCNVARLNADEATLVRLLAAPVVYDLGDYTAPAVDSVDAGADTMDVSFLNTDPWANEDLAGMIIAISRPTNPGINYFKGPYRFSECVLGDSGTPPTSPVTIALPFPVAAGQRVFIQVRVTRADGRLSASFRGSGLAA